MGIDLAVACAPVWTRDWDRQRVELSQPTLFAQATPVVDRTIRVSPRNDAVLEPGKQYQVRLVEHEVIVLDGITIVAKAKEPSDHLLKTLGMAPGALCYGTIVQVHEVTKSGELQIK